MKWGMVWLISLLVLAAAGSSGARTWYVNEAGTGDAPTISAAMDSAAYGDTVLVGPGTYVGSIAVTEGVTLRSEIGPAHTTLTAYCHVIAFPGVVAGCVEGFTPTGVQCPDFEDAAVEVWGSQGVVVANNVITGNLYDGIWFYEQSRGEITGNTIVDNGHDGIHVSGYSMVDAYRNICVCNVGGFYYADGVGDVACNNSWGNLSTSWDPTGDGNFSADPLFCDREAGDFTLNRCSPCLPGNHPYGFDCGLIGALGQGCDYPSHVEGEGGRSWGGVKVLFR